MCGVPVTGTTLPPITLPAGEGGTVAIRFQLLRDRFTHAVESGAPARYRASKSSIRTSPARTRDRGLSGEHAAARDRLDRRPERLVGDVPLAAQLLSVIA